MNLRSAGLLVTALLVSLAAGTVPAAAQPAPGVGPEYCTSPPPGDLYHPKRGQWETRRPAEAGMDSAALERAVRWAADTAHGGWGPDLRRDLMFFLSGAMRGPPGEPQNNIVGPVKPRGPQTGVVIRDGYIVREWGDPHRVDMTFSVTKSFLSTVTGVAWDRGLIRSVHDPVRAYVPDSLFATPHNEGITWDHLLRQTSDWRGTLFGKPDWVDRFDGTIHEPDPPGTAFEYNDVRVNLLSLSTLHVLREPLPAVLREAIMNPIGASSTWRWHGYETSWITLDGKRVQVVSGGGHWGGGMWISARDQARFGLLTLRCGRWEGEQLLSREWIRMATTPTEMQHDYGYMNWFLNTGREAVPAAPEKSFYHAGAGVNRIFVSPEHDLVVVARWIDGEHYGDFIERVLAAVEE